MGKTVENALEVVETEAARDARLHHEAEAFAGLMRWITRLRLDRLEDERKAGTLYDLPGETTRLLAHCEQACYDVQRAMPPLRAMAGGIWRQIRAIRALLIWQCNECGTIFRQDQDQVDTGEEPECPDCGSVDIEPS
jgi:DNA-directed RNA polymerase subunit RPC12/RpoP